MWREQSEYTIFIRDKLYQISKKENDSRTHIVLVSGTKILSPF